MFTSKQPNATSNQQPSAGRSLFSKPTFIKQPVTVSEPTTLDYFDRRNKTFDQIAAEDARRRKERQKRKEKQRAKEAEAQDRHNGKRRRVTDEDEDGFSSHSGSDSEATSEHDIVESSERVKHRDSEVNDKVSDLKTGENLHHKPHTARLLSRSKSPEKRTTPTTKPTPQPSPNKQLKSPPPEEVIKVVEDVEEDGDAHDSDVESVEEFPELAALARKRALESKLAEQQSQTPAPDSPAKRLYTESPVAVVQAREQLSAPKPNQNVRILVLWRHDPSDKPVSVYKRALHANFVIVRKTFCQSRNMPEDQADQIVLAFKGIRVFDVISCKTLGFDVDEEGYITYDGQRTYTEDADWDVQMEAMTLEELAQDRKRRDAAKQETDFSNEILEHHKQPIPAFEIFLTAKERKTAVKLRVQDKTPLSRALALVQSKFETPEGKKAFFIFDGEDMDSSKSIGDYELEDGDTLEVHYR